MLKCRQETGGLVFLLVKLEVDDGKVLEAVVTTSKNDSNSISL